MTLYVRPSSLYTVDDYVNTNSSHTWKSQTHHPPPPSGEQRTTSRPPTPKKSTITSTTVKSTATLCTTPPSTRHHPSRTPYPPPPSPAWCTSGSQRTLNSCSTQPVAIRRMWQRLSARAGGRAGRTASTCIYWRKRWKGWGWGVRTSMSRIWSAGLRQLSRGQHRWKKRQRGTSPGHFLRQRLRSMIFPGRSDQVGILHSIHTKMIDVLFISQPPETIILNSPDSLAIRPSSHRGYGYHYIHHGCCNPHGRSSHRRPH